MFIIYKILLNIEKLANYFGMTVESLGQLLYTINTFITGCSNIFIIYYYSIF